MSEYKAHFVKPSPWGDALGWTLVAVLMMATVTLAMLTGYRVGYADGARQAAPLTAPPTTTERAR